MALEVGVVALFAVGVTGVQDTALAALNDAHSGLLAAACRRFGQAEADELAALVHDPGDHEPVHRAQLSVRT